MKVFEEREISIIQENKNEQLMQVNEFTDGCAAQYKGKNAFYDLSLNQSPVIQRNFFETSHGKSVCDGLGAVVKMSCFQEVVSGKIIIKDAQDLRLWTEEVVSTT